MAEEVPQNIEAILEREAGIPSSSTLKKGAVEDNAPVYQMIADSKIPVSNARGKLWQSRKAIGMKKQKVFADAYEESCEYYRNAHDGKQAHKQSRANKLSSGSNLYTENIVYANTKTMLPIVYARDPSIEVTEESRDPETREVLQKRVTVAERLINKLLTMRDAPGVNLKPKARRAILSTLLGNYAYGIVGYNQKKGSSEEALENLQTLGEQLAKAKTTKEIKQIEGKLQAIESTVDMLNPSGFSLKIKSISDVVIDPDSIEPDLSDATWMMYCEYLSTDALNAQFGKDKEGSVVSIYHPTHVLDARADGDGDNPDTLAQEIASFSLFKDEASKSNFGFSDEQTYCKAQRTKVWWIWDKITRRLELYADNRWKFPIWVWDDPLELDGFFPIIDLSFNIDPDRPFAKGEVSYYLDHQDAINESNSELRRIRTQIRRNILFDKKSMDVDDVNKVLKGADGTARGINLPEGKSIKDVIFSFEPPSANMIQFFDKSGEYQAIDRLSSVNEQIRGGQFKTNTTNRAVDFVRDSNSIQLEDKVDLIEDWVGRIGNSMLQIALKQFDVEMVESLLGAEDAEEWRVLQENARNNPNRKLSIQVVGGSTVKPTSSAKKEEATAVGQILGQFVSAAPGVAVVMLKLFEQSFDGINMTEEDWGMIRTSIEASIQSQQPQQGAQPQPQAAPQQQQQQPPPLPDQQGQPSAAAGIPPEMVEQIIQAIQIATDQGVPIEEAVAGVLQEVGIIPEQPVQGEL